MEAVSDIWFSLTALGQRYMRMYRWWERAFIAAGVGLFLAGAGMGIGELIYCWRTGVWQNYFLRNGGLPFYLVVLSALGWLPIASRPSVSTRADVESLRSAALAGGEQGAPLADVPPQSATAANPTPPSQMIRVRSPQRDNAWLLAVIAGGALIFLLPLTLLNIALAIDSDPTLPHVNTALFIGLNSMGFLLSLGTVPTTGIWAYRLFRAGRFIADADGLRLVSARPGGDSAVSWARARAFWRIEHHVPGQPSGRLYGLDAGDQLLVWSPPGGRRRRQAHEALLSEIHTRTGLPLRDLSAETSAIITRDKRARSARRYLPLAVPLLAALLLAGSAWAGAALAPQRFSGLVARIHAEQPIYADPLSAPNADWPANGSNGMGAIPSFVDGRLQLATTDQYIISTAQTPAFYQDAAIEVTVRQLSGDAGSDVGLVVRGPVFDDNAVSFTVNPRGEWSASAFDFQPDDWYNIYNQRDPAAIHTGAGAENTLLLVMHGSQYLFYCNGHYLGAYVHDPVPEAAVTLLAEGRGAVGQFSDLTIYPAPDF